MQWPPTSAGAFDNNLVSTFHVFQAAKLLKIHNLVWYDQPGFDNFIIANADTVMSCPSTDLMAEYFPRTEVRSPLEGTQALCSIDKARRLLGWEPRHTWRDHVSA